MNGSYRGYSAAMIIAGAALFLLISLFCSMNTDYSILKPCMIPPVLMLLWLSDNMPCRFSADSDGFEIGEMGFKTRYEYTDVWNIKYVQERKKTGDYIKLTVSGGFGDKVYYEKSGADCSQLAELCRYIGQMTNYRI